MKLNLPCKLSCLNSNLVLTLGYLNPALNNSALGFGIWNSASGILTMNHLWRGIQNPRLSWINTLHGANAINKAIEKPYNVVDSLK